MSWRHERGSETNVRRDVDQGKVEEVLSQLTLPPELERVETRYGKDHTGDPAVFLTFYLKEGVRAEREEIRPLSQFLTAVTFQLLDAGIGGFPYTRLTDPA